MREVWIIDGVRTPLGALCGTLAEATAVELGVVCATQLLERTNIRATDVDEVIFGNVVSAGLGQNPARQVSVRAGLPFSAGATTVNKVCGSGLKAVMLAAQAILVGDANVVMAGGIESMSRAPYLLAKARQGYRLGHGELLDSVIVDGLWDCYGQQHMGSYADRCATECHLTREDQDRFAIRSFTRAREAAAEGVFKSEIVPVPIQFKQQWIQVTEDEGPARFDESKLRRLLPAFGKEGTVTAGNASSINDGAAALIVASDRACRELGVTPKAKVVGAVTFSREPEWFTLAPIGAIRKLLERVGWSVASTDLFEINEAFSCVPLAAERELNIPSDKVNIYGGAVALGHPIGCSGARILVTLLNALQRTGGQRGIACLCVGGGEAVALAVERLSSSTMN